MKNLFKILIVLVGIVFMTPACFAEQQKVLVLPDCLKFSSTNYYVYPDTSVLFATEVVNELNKSGKVETVSMVELRKKLREDLKLNILAEKTLKEFKYNYNINFVDLKSISAKFGVDKILVITSTTDVQNYFLRRTLWDFLNIPGASVLDPAYKVSSFAALVDVKNEIILWQQTYSKLLTSVEQRMIPVGFAPAAQQVDKLKLYSKVLTPEIANNVEKQLLPKVQTNVKGDVLPINVKKQDENIIPAVDAVKIEEPEIIEVKSKPFKPATPRKEIAPPLINDL